MTPFRQWLSSKTHDVHSWSKSGFWKGCNWGIGRLERHLQSLLLWALDGRKEAHGKPVAEHWSFWRTTWLSCSRHIPLETANPPATPYPQVQKGQADRLITSRLLCLCPGQRACCRGYFWCGWLLLGLSSVNVQSDGRLVPSSAEIFVILTYQFSFEAVRTVKSSRKHCNCNINNSIGRGFPDSGKVMLSDWFSLPFSRWLIVLTKIDFLTCDKDDGVLQDSAVSTHSEEEGWRRDRPFQIKWLDKICLGAYVMLFMVRLRIIGHQKGPTNTEYDQNSMADFLNQSA